MFYFWCFLFNILYFRGFCGTKLYCGTKLRSSYNSFITHLSQRPENEISNLNFQLSNFVIKLKNFGLFLKRQIIAKVKTFSKSEI